MNGKSFTIFPCAHFSYLAYCDVNYLKFFIAPHNITSRCFIIFPILLIFLLWIFTNYLNILIANFFVFPFRKSFHFLQFQVKLTSKTVELPGLRKPQKPPVLRCHVYKINLNLLCSFVTHRKSSGQRFPYFNPCSTKGFQIIFLNMTFLQKLREPLGKH